MMSSFLLRQSPCAGKGALSGASSHRNHRLFRLVERISPQTSSFLFSRERGMKPALSPLTNSSRLLRMTATNRQKFILRLCENRTRWSRLIACCPTTLHSAVERLRTDYIMRFSNPNDGKKEDGKEKSDEENKDSEREPNFNDRVSKFLFVAAVLYVLDRLLVGNASFISWDDFVEKYLLVGEVEYIRVNTRINSVEAIVNVKTKSGKMTLRALKLLPSKEIAFEKVLRDLEDKMGLPQNERVEIRYVSANADNEIMVILAITYILAMLTRGGVRELFKSARKGGDGMGPPGGQPPPPGLGQFFDPTQGMNRVRSSLNSSQEMKKMTQGMRFKDVAGMKAAKQEVIEFVEYLKRPDKYVQLGAKLPKGALLLGPPGCGKTLLVKALANEADVPFFFMAGSEFVEVIGGVGASRMRQLFSEARQAAPSIIFIDEIDTIGRNRSSQASGGDSGFAEVEQTLNQLLVEMDGMDTGKGVIVFAATNRSEVLDRALLRPGRFDRIITIDLPTIDERREIFDLHLGSYKLSGPPEKFSKKLASLTPGMNGADIANVCNEAALAAVRKEHAAVVADDFDTALQRVQVGSAKKTRVLSGKERERVAAHEAGHTVVGWMLRHTDPVMRVSILPRVASPLGFSQAATEDKRLYSQDDLFDRMTALLGGRVAESFYYSDLSSGAQDDLERVTDMAYLQIRQLGMNKRVGHVSYNFSKEDHQHSLMPYSKHLQNIMDQEAQALLQAVLKAADDVVKKNWEAMDKIKNALMERETLNYEDVEDLIGPRPFGRRLVTEDLRWSEA